MSETILVTGATGNVGLEVVKKLQRHSAPVAAAVRDPAKAQRTLANVALRRFDFQQPDTFGAALQGVQKLFLVRPPELADVQRDVAPLIRVAHAAGVEHVVFLSLLGVDRARFAPHYAIEQLLRASGMAWTFLQASFFMQNLNTVHRYDIRDGSEIFVPAGDGRTSFIDVRDIAAVGALALTEAGHRNQAYPLTGSEALNYTQVAAIFSATLGRPVRYTNPSLLAFAVRMRARGFDWSYIGVMTAIYITARLGIAATVTPDTARLLGRQPISVRQYAEDYRRYWV